MRKLSYYIAQKLIDKSGKANSISIVAYGIECTLSTLLILAMLMTAGFLLQKPGDMLIYIAAWLPLRIIVGGAHANTHWMCTLVSVGLGAISVWLSDYIISIPAAAMIGIAFCCYAVFFLTAPVVYKNHPISERIYRKTRIIARAYAAAELAVIAILSIIGSAFAPSTFMGFFTTSVLAAIGWFGKSADRTCRNSITEKGMSTEG